jgi:hypothetical protein
LGCTANGTKLKVLATLNEGHKAYGRVPRNILLTNSRGGNPSSNVACQFVVDVLKPFMNEWNHEEIELFLDNSSKFKNARFHRNAVNNNIGLNHFPLNCHDEVNPAKIWIEQFKESFIWQWNRILDLGRSGRKGYLLWPGYAKVI